jgi:hypothetical protein
MYFWQNPSSPLPSNEYTFVLDGWPGLAEDEWFLFSTWVAVQTVSGEVGFVEAPLQVGSANLVPLFDPTTGEVHCTGMSGARLVAVATVFKIPETAYAGRPQIRPAPGLTVVPSSR